MKKRLTKICFACVAVAGLLLAVGYTPAEKINRTTPIYLNTNYTFEERAVDLVSRLTLEEKQSLIGNNQAAVPRLGIPAYNIWSEALHGVLAGGNAAAGVQGPSSFSNSVAIGSSWSVELAEIMGTVITDEARAMNQAGVEDLTFWSPVVEPIRDPRWGRTGESYGEDPFLAAQIAGGFVRGFVGADEKYLKAVPTAKHFFANNSEFDRHVSSSNMDSRDMREFYLLPYKKLIEEDALPSIMSSYNAVNGVPTSASVLYLDSIARRTYGMKGYVTGDCAAIEDIYTGHYYKETAEEATAAGLIAGVDSDCGSVYQRAAISALNQGLITMADIDRALVNVFTIRMRTGEFDPDYKVPYTRFQPSVVNSKSSQELAMEIATLTPVLLKNENQVLPLDKNKAQNITVFGPQANKVVLGPYSGRPEATSMITPYQGLEQYIKDNNLNINLKLVDGGSTLVKSNLLYIGNFTITKIDGTKTYFDATKYNGSSQGITVGTGMGTEEQVRSIDDGSWTSYDNIDIMNIDSITVGINIPTEGGLVEVRIGSPDGNLIATIEATAASGKRVGGVYGGTSPLSEKANRLGYNEPQTLYLVYKAPQDAPIDQATIDAAKAADVAIIFVGTDEKTATEEADRLTLLLPGNQLDLIKAVSAVNPNTIVFMQTLGCVEVEEFKNIANIPSIVWTGYNGMAQGAAVPKVLFGDVTPGGKLNATWYKSVKDLPEITDYTLRGNNGSNGRTLWYFKKDISYEFGYGISYTTFEYSNFRISKSAITPNDKITISVDVTNTGKYDGDEVVQIYMTTPDSPASAQRPIKRLKGFHRVTLPMGATKTVDINIDCKDLWFWDMDSDKMTYDQGRYVFEVGSSSKDIRGTLTSTMSGTLAPEVKTVVADCGVSVMRSGETADTYVTAAMNDDSFYDITKAKVTYKSSNPSVASVDANGKVSAKSMGVATITVNVDVNGSVACDDYAIKVMPDMTLANLTVAGKSILKAGASQYSVVAKAGSAPQVVAATASDANISVDIKQAKSVPGSAVITLTDYITYDVKEYVVNFGTKPVSDKFSSLGKQWSWVRESSKNWSMTEKPGYLVLTTEAGDITNAANSAKNILLQSANGDFTADTKMQFLSNPGAPAQNAGIVAYEDDDNFVKLVYSGGGMMRQAPTAGASAAGNLMLVAEGLGNQKASVSVSLKGIIKADNVVYLRLVKKSSEYTAFYSVDGKKFTEVGKVDVVLKDIQAGVIACDGVMAMGGRRGPVPAAPAVTTTPLKVAVDYFNVK